jgi:hypothetical protein
MVQCQIGERRVRIIEEVIEFYSVKNHKRKEALKILERQKIGNAINKIVEEKIGRQI